MKAHRQRPVRFVLETLRRVKQIGAGVARRRWRKAQHHVFRIFLEHAEGALRKGLKVEVAGGRRLPRLPSPRGSCRGETTQGQAGS